MKRIIVFALAFLSFVVAVRGQGVFFFWIGGTARTRVGSINGPYAGPDILAQMFIGPTTESLTPVGLPVPHQAGTGLVAGGDVTVPGIPGNTYVFAQMIAWDQTLWGSSVNSVPQERRGYTDVVPLFLTYPLDPHVAPQFTQPAIVPIPEPSAWALLALGAAALWFMRRRRK